MGSYRKKWLAGLLSVSLLAGSFGGFRTASADTKEVSEGTVTSVKADKLPAGDVILPEAIPLSYTDTVKLSSVPVYYAESAPDLSGLDPVISGGIGSYGKEKLGDAQKNFYDSLEKACVEFLQSNKNLDSGSVYAGAASYKDCGLTKDQALKTYITFYYDHPAYFWLGGYGTDDSKLYVAVRDDYFKDTVRDSVESMIISGVGAYAAEAAKYSDVWEKVRAIHDKMILDVEYAYKSDGKTPENTSWAHTVEGVFNTARKEVVCEGYSKAFSLITNYLGIPSVFIVGNAGGAHAWNAVSFDGGNTYSYMDLTWDDAKGTEISYQWFAMPKKNFESKHEAYKTSGSGWNWQYGLPTLTTDMTYTYFSKKNAYATAAVVKDDASARTFLQKAGAAASAPAMVILADTKEIIGLLTKAQAGVSYTGYSYYTSEAYGKYYWTFDASRYKVQKAATSIAFSETAVSVDKAETPSRTLTITPGPSDSDDWVLLSTDNARVVSLSTPNLDLSKGKTVTLTFLGTGTATITARSLVGNSEKTCTVTVTSSIASEHVYLDEKLQKAADGTAFAYANGSTKKTGNMSVNYKASVLYTDLLAPVYKTAKGKATGKILVGLTTEMQEPVVKDNKVAKDAAANQLASVSYKKFTTESKETIGKITVTAKKPGTVYAWIFALTTKDNIQTVGYAPVTLKPAPTKVIFQNTPCVSGEANSTFGTVTSRMAAIGTPFDIYLNPTVAVVQKIRQTVTENTFSLSVPDASKSYIKVEKKAGSQYGYTITPLALKDGKKTKVVLKAVCGENTTNAKLTVTITNSVKKMNFAKLDSTEDSFTVTDVANQSLKVKIAASAGLFARTAKLKETVTLYDSSAANLDGTKIYQIPSATGFTVANAGNVTVEKGITAERKKVSMKLVKGTTDEYQITVNAGFGDGQTAYLLVVHNGLAGQGAGCRVIEVTVGASGIKGNENPIWANAKDTELKKTKVNTSLAPTAYTSGRKTVYGKLVWICRQEKKDPEFNASTHKVTTKSDSKVASVNADGVVTAKAGGTAYVYAVDTGTGNFDLIEVPVKDTPLDIRMYKAASADPTKGDAEYKKETVAQGGKVDVYVQGTVGSVRAGTMKVLTGSGYDYTYSVADSQKDYVSVTQDGAHFTVNVAADAWTKAGLTGNKKLSIKVNFICVKNGKKGTFTLSVTKG